MKNKDLIILWRMFGKLELLLGSLSNSSDGLPECHVTRHLFKTLH
jgi:hypothetical protein